MLHKINKNVVYRKEMDSLLILSPKTKRLLIFNKDIADSINYNNDTIDCADDNIIDILKKEEII